MVTFSLVAFLSLLTSSFLIKYQNPFKNQTSFAVSQPPLISQNVGIETERNDADNVNVPGPRHYMELREVTDAQERPEGAEATETSPYLEINEYAPLHPATRSLEVSRETVVIEKVIGQGAFGQVAQGKASELRGREGTITVAVKMLKGNILHCNSISFAYLA